MKRNNAESRPAYERQRPAAPVLVSLALAAAAPITVVLLSDPVVSAVAAASAVTAGALVRRTSGQQ